MPSPITYVCLAIIVGSLGVAKAIGITVPRVWAPFDKEFAIIVGVQFVTLWFSSNIAIAVTVQPEQREGDVDGILDAKLLEYDTLENQMIIAMTTTFAAAMLILGHVCCPGGHWQAASGDGVTMLLTGMIGESLFFFGSIPYFIGDVETTKRRKKEINEMLVAHYPGWAAADDGKDNKERKSK